MEHISNLQLEAAEPAAVSPTAPATAPAEGGASYAVGGVICLIAGLFIFGVPCALLAINLGGKAARNGAVGFGNFVRVAAWIELVLMLFLLVAQH
jgi:hypothetical protein